MPSTANSHAHGRLDDFLRKAQPLYAIIDGARSAALPYKIATSGLPFRSLYDGDAERDLCSVAPYLVKLESANEFTDYLLGRVWGQSFGVYLTCRSPFADLRSHLRRFLMVQKPDGKPAYFRYYDPRVLRTFIPSCHDREAADFFGPVDAYWAEGPTGETLLRFVYSGFDVTVRELNLRRASTNPKGEA